MSEKYYFVFSQFIIFSYDLYDIVLNAILHVLDSLNDL